MVKKIKGLTPGKYLVKIFSTESEASSTSGAEVMDRDNDSNVKPAKQKVPPEYNTDSQQFIDVSIEGKNKFDFNINT